MVFSLEITNIWQKSGDFWFADWYGFSYGFLVVFNVFHQFLLEFITNLKFYKRCFIKDDLQTPSPLPPPPQETIGLSHTN
jgi:hypothetical protein